jgi:hypothetical protein
MAYNPGTDPEYNDSIELTCKKILEACAGIKDAIDSGGGGGGSTTPRTSTFTLLSASSSVNIPTSAKAWSVSMLTGTGTIGGVAVPAGFNDSSLSPPAVAIAVATNSASTAYVRWES